MGAPLIRVAIVDPETGYRAGLEIVLKRDPNVMVAGLYDSIAGFFDRMEPVDVVLVSERCYQSGFDPTRFKCPTIAMPKSRKRRPDPTIPPGFELVVPRSAPLTDLLIAIHRLANR